MKQKDYDLLQATIQQGVDALGEYFREQVGKKIHLIESDGIEDYPERGIPAASAMRLLLQKMPSFTDEQYFFSDRSRTLVLKVSLRDEGRQLYVCISDVNAKEIRSVMGAVEPARTALAYILRNRIEVARGVEERTDAVLTNAFGGSSRQFVEACEKSGLHLDADRKYSVMLVDLGQDPTESTTVDFRASLMWLDRKAEGADFYPLIWRDRYLAILSGIVPRTGSCREEDQPAWTDLIRGWRQEFSASRKLTVSIGIGEVHPLAELFRSYEEARIALAYGMTKGERGFIRWSRNLGVIRAIFAQGMDEAIAFYRDTLGRIADHETDSDLRTTLRVLLETNFNFKLTAERLFVHTNTVRYRYERISQLIDGKNISADMRINLYAALRVGEILREIDVLAPGYVGLATRSNIAQNHS